MWDPLNSVCTPEIGLSKRALVLRSVILTPKSTSKKASPGPSASQRLWLRSPSMSDDALEIAKASAAAMWADDVASQKMGMALTEVAPGTASLTMAVREDMVNGHGICHGGFIFSLADSAFAFACNTYDQVTVAAAADITFVKPAKLGDELTAIAAEQVRYGRSGVYDVIVIDQNGDMVATFRGRSRTIGGSFIAGG